MKRDMRKEYRVPQMEVMEIKVGPQLLAGSNYGGKFNAPQMNDDDWDFEEE
jgi:hypothetical protein